MPRNPQTKGEAQASPAFDLAATVGQGVVRLPTAPRRQVQQRWNRWTREERRRLREQAPWPGEYIFPAIREAARRIEELRAMPPSPAVNLARNLVDRAGTEDAKAVLRIIRCGYEHKEPLALEVVALLERVSGTTYGEFNDFLQARILQAEGY